MNKKISIILTLIILLTGCTCIMAQHVGAGGWHSLSVCSDSTVKAFGENATGQLGNGGNTDSNLPVTAIGLTGIMAVSGGGDQLEAHSLALKSDGSVWSWGSNIYGALGNGTTTNTNTPGQVLIMSDAIAIAAGGWHSAALKSDGTVWTWGWNVDGQLGDGSFTDRILPAKVNGLTDITQIAAGTYHMMALKDDGTVWTWGDNVSGQIGDGTTNDRTTPYQVAGLTNIVKINAGRFFSLAVKNDGTVWTWGENLYGQLGNGTTTDSHVPVQVNGLTVAVPAVVATGAFHCMVLKTDGTIWAWGRNTYGNLGDNSVTHRSTPVQMLNITNVTDMTAGTNFSLLVKGDGTLWGCGRNASGQLGDGTFLQHNIVEQATSLCSVMQPLGVAYSGLSGTLEVQVYPNPSSNGIFTVQIADDAPKQIKDAEIEIFSPMGVRLMHTSVEGILSKSLKIDLTEYPDGIYFISLISEGHQIFHKLIKQ